MWFVCMCTSVMFHVGLCGSSELIVLVLHCAGGRKARLWAWWPSSSLNLLLEAGSPWDSLVIYIVFQNKKSTEHPLGVGLSYEYFGLLVVSAASVVMGFIGKHHSAPGKWGMVSPVHWSGWVRSISHFTCGSLWDAILNLLFCLWENKSLFYCLNCVFCKLARGLYYPVDLVGVWDGVVIAVPEYTQCTVVQSFLCRKNKRSLFLYFFSFAQNSEIDFCRQPMYWFL